MGLDLWKTRKQIPCKNYQPYGTYTKCTYFMPRAHLNDFWTDRWHMYVTVSRRGMCFWDDQQCATWCEEDSKFYIERVPGSERDFQHLIEREDMIVLCFAAAAPSYSLILLQTSHCILDLCLCFRFCVSLLALSSLLSSQLFSSLTLRHWPLVPL